MADNISFQSSIDSLRKLQGGQEAQYINRATDVAGVVDMLGAEMTSSQQAIGMANESMAAAKRSRDVATQTAITKAMSAAGIDPTNPDAEVNRLVQNINNLQSKSEKLQAQMSDLSSTDFTSNPIKWLINQIKLEFVGNDFNQTNDQLQMFTQQAQQRQVLGQEAVKNILNANLIESETEHQANLKKLHALTSLEVSKTHIDSEFNGLRALSEAYGAEKSGLESEIRLTELVVRDRERARNELRDSLDISRIQLQLRQLQKQEETNAQMERLIKLTAATLGVPADQVMNMPTELLAKVPGVENAIMPVIATGSVGLGPYTAYSNALSAGGGLYNQPYRARVKNWTDKKIKEVTNSIQSQPNAPTKPDQLVARLDKELWNVAVREAENTQNSDSDLYKFYTVGAYAGSNGKPAPRLANTKLYKEYLSKFPQGQITAELLFTKATELIKEGKFSVKEAAKEIAEISQLHKEIVNASIGAKELALPQLQRVNFIPSRSILGGYSKIKKEYGDASSSIDNELELLYRMKQPDTSIFAPTESHQLFR